MDHQIRNAEMVTMVTTIMDEVQQWFMIVTNDHLSDDHCRTNRHYHYHHG